MKKIIVPIICLLLIAITFYKSDDISSFIANKITSSPKLVIPEKGKYAKNESYKYVQITDNFIPYSYQDLKNIIYTIMDNRWESFTFYCPSEYENCLNDIEQLRNDKLALTYINDFVHPYNSFESMKTSVSSNGEIIIMPNYLYTTEQIEKIEQKTNEIIKNSTVMNNSSSTLKDKIKYFHDYIINHTTYDVIRSQDGTSEYQSHTAYGPLFEGKAICNGYADAMAIFLTKIGINNYKIATPAENITDAEYGHIWNAVLVDNKWLHLDLTWDDPISSDGKNYLFYKYFLVNNEGLKKADSGSVVIEEHNFDDTVYLEFNSLMK